MNESILVTGGAGYIGSHTCVELLNAGYAVTVFDNYCNSKPESLNRVERIAGKSLRRVQGDVRDRPALIDALRASNASAVIHFAGLKAVGDSVRAPQSYYDSNVVGSLRLLEAMTTCQVKTLVFSSSATVYGDPVTLPYREDHPLSPTSPYGRSKLMVEQMLRDVFASDPRSRFASLRYFNPVGAHPSGLIGEDPRGVPNNLLPFVAQVAVGKRERLNVWGNDYATADGTGVRDYIHVVDLALAHLKALNALAGSATANPHVASDAGQCFELNVGTGNGFSVMDVLSAFAKSSGKPIPYSIQPRRSGDIAAYFADPTAAAAKLGWKPLRDLNDMCTDTWRWQSANPDGYQ
jgi:UDP-glucose 4-epimerase